jgi:hypothetical protein
MLVEALPYCETVEDFTCVVEDYSLSMVEEAIVFQDTQPRRRLLTLWLEQLEVKASLIEVGSTGNIYNSPVLPTQGAAYHQVASGRDLETLVEALPWCETVEDFASVIEGFRAEVVKEAIALKPFGFQSELLAWLVGGG